MRKTNMALIIGILVFLQACGGRNPNPIVRYQPGDEKRTCTGLKSEIAVNEVEIIKLLPKESKTGKNVILGVTGAFLIVPLFFMDFKDAERVEIQALRRRNMWLREVASNKDCTIPPSKIRFQQKKQVPPPREGLDGRPLGQG